MKIKVASRRCFARFLRYIAAIVCPVGCYDLSYFEKACGLKDAADKLQQKTAIEKSIMRQKRKLSRA